MFAVTYEIVTEESAARGDVDERGWVARDMGLRDAVRELMSTRTNAVDGIAAIECDDWPATSPRAIIVQNGTEFRTGAQESRTLHMPDRLSRATRRRIARLLGAL